MSFKPRKSDLIWQNKFFDSISDGGFWVTENAIYQIDKTNKTLTVKGTWDFFSDPEENVYRVAKVCEAIGWRVIS